MKLLILIIANLILSANTFAQFAPSNEAETHKDMITPAYYTIPNDQSFKNEVDKFLYYVRAHPFQHPLDDNTGQTPTYNILRDFGDLIGTRSHHPARDFYIGNKETDVNLYAAHDGQVSISRDITRYRHYLAITTEIMDSAENILGQLMSIYAHIDLDLDAQDSLNLDGQMVKKGDLISKNLYSGTMGGPHLHFEIRYYRTTDTANEDFYGGQIGDKTEISAGPWSYGFWNPNNGYGFGHPLNHIASSDGTDLSSSKEKTLTVYPNPAQDNITICLPAMVSKGNLSICHLDGRIVYQQDFSILEDITINTSQLPTSIYILNIMTSHGAYSTLLSKE